MKIAKKVLDLVIFLLCFVVTPFIYGKYTSRYGIDITLNVSKPVYTVVFHSNNGVDETSTQNFVYGTSQALKTNAFTKINYIFAEWNSEADGSGTSYSDEEVVDKLTSINNDNVDLYAQWRRELTFTVVGNPSNWTNQDVMLTIVPDIADTYEYSFDNGATWQNSTSHTFSSNQTVHMKIRTIDEFTSNTVSETITKIDKNAPNIQLSANSIIVTLDESNPIGTIASASDNESGIDATGLQVYRYVIENSNTTDLITNTNYFTYPGRYAISLIVTDVAGNTTNINSEILVRWPTGGKYVVKKTRLDGDGIVGQGLSSSTSPDGLYKDTAATGGNVDLPFASKYYYTGPTVANYLSFANSTFRVLNISTNDDIKVLGDVSDVKVAWGNRKIYDSNTYNTWSTKWWPRGQIYNNETGESKYKMFTATEKAHLDQATFYAGRFNKDNAPDISYTIYYEQTGGVNLGGSNDTNPAFEGYSAYPNISDYLKASKAHDYVVSIADTQDTTILGLGIDKRQIFNDNSWIDMSIDQWTINSKNSTSTDNDFWVVDGTLRGRIISRTYYYNQQYRVVFYINDATILSGDGSSANPYTVEEDWNWFDSTQVLQ